MNYIKLIIMSLIFSASVNAALISDETLINKCVITAFNKLSHQAKKLNCEFDEREIYVDEIYNQTLNPSASIWYSVEACDGDITITELVQYFKGECF